MGILAKKFCPECGSENVQMVAGGITGGWMCGDCGYTGQCPEKPLVIRSGEGDKVIEDIRKSVGGKKKK